LNVSDLEDEKKESADLTLSQSHVRKFLSGCSSETVQSKSVLTSDRPTPRTTGVVVSRNNEPRKGTTLGTENGAKVVLNRSGNLLKFHHLLQSPNKRRS
jgi:hypothetical protein